MISALKGACFTNLKLLTNISNTHCARNVFLSGSVVEYLKKESNDHYVWFIKFAFIHR